MELTAYEQFNQIKRSLYLYWVRHNQLAALSFIPDFFNAVAKSQNR